MNLAFCVNEGYVKYLCVALASLLKSNKNTDFTVYVLSPGLSGSDERHIRQTSEKHSCQVVLTTIRDSFFEGLPLTKHFDKSIYFRLAMQDLVPCDKVLYLDADLLVLSSIEQLYNTDIQHYYLAAVRDPIFKNHSALGLSQGSTYFNSGVMLINNKKFRAQDMKRRVIEFVSENPARIKYPDQCGLNRIVDGNWFELGPEFNVQTPFLNEMLFEDGIFECFEESNFLAAIREPTVIHYTGASKPWHYINAHPYKTVWWRYLQFTPFADAKPEGRNIKNIFRKYAPRVIVDYAESLFVRRS
jgi:lipopolysaccharide biosynthesis glycosyltransferase